MTTNIHVSDKSEDIDFEFVYRFLSGESIWAEGIGRKTQQRAIDNSLCISAFREDKQVGFARAVTDYATFVWIDDVFVASDARRLGVARRLIQTIVAHPSLATVPSWWLSSSNPKARALFVEFGFAEPDEERIAKWMGRPKVKTVQYKE